MNWLRRLTTSTTRTRSTSTARTARPTLESLEDRQLLTVTYHGGALLQHVKVQALYYGADWYNNRTLYQQTGQFEGYLRYMVNSPYMDMLTNAGYSVGRGTFDGGKISLANINKNYYLTDRAIQGVIQTNINNGVLKTPDGNRLYIVYVEPGVAVNAGGATSIRDFLGYHSAFSGTDGHGHRLGIAYAVIPYQGGINARDTRVSTFESATEVTSHEIAEAVTDPMTNGRLGWFDDAYGRAHGGEGEIGDIVAGQIVRLNGYVVQKEAAKNDQPLSPAGAQSLGFFAGHVVSNPSAKGAFSAFVSLPEVAPVYQSVFSRETEPAAPKKTEWGAEAKPLRLSDEVFRKGESFWYTADEVG